MENGELYGVESKSAARMGGAADAPWARPYQGEYMVGRTPQFTHGGRGTEWRRVPER